MATRLVSRLSSRLLKQHYSKVIDHAVKNQLIQTPIKADELLNPKFTRQAIQNLQANHASNKQGTRQ